MATISASTPTSSIISRVQKPSFGLSSFPAVVGLPAICKVGRVRCSMEGKQSEAKKGMMQMGASASLMAAAIWSNPAMALVDERLSTEGTGLPFGLSNNLLGWILLAVFALIWALYFVYTADLEEDEESGLSL